MGVKTLIVGSGRSGTGWCSQVLNQAGVRCGHQSVFKHEHTLTGAVPVWGQWQADSSYEAVPLLPLGGVNTILVVRHPLAVIRSWLEHGAFYDDMPERFTDLWTVLQQRFPKVLQQKTPVDRAASFWLVWNRYAEEHADAICLLETLTPHDLCRLVIPDPPSSLSLPPVDPSISDKQQTLPPVQWLDVSPWLRGSVQAWTESVGYDVS